MLYLIVFLAASASAATNQPQQDVCLAHPADCVDTRRGTDSNRSFSRGNTFPATAVPFGFNMWTPMTEPDTIRWLYRYEQSQWLGVALTHQASPWMGDFGTLHIAPALDVPRAAPKQRGQAFSHDHETATPHHYGVALNNGTKVDLAPTSHAAIITVQFPQGHTPYLIIDNVRSAWGSLSVDERTGTVQGTLTSRDYSHNARTQYVFAQITGASVAAVERLAGRPVGIAVQLATPNNGLVTLKVASSWIGIAEAQQSLEAEVGHKTFAEVAEEGRGLWDEALAKMTVEGATDDIRRIYINNMYRTLLYPNTLAEGAQPHYRSPYDGNVHEGTMGINNGFWDTYRAVWPLHDLLRPTFAGTLLDGFVQAYKQSGWTPRWSAPGHNAMMVGSHSDAIFADAYVKGIRNFDVRAAWQSALKNATAPSPQEAWGRPANERAQYLGFVPADEAQESASWHLEDCVNDFALSAWAQALQKADEQAYFAQRSQSYMNLFSPSVGFFRGRKADGSWRSKDKDFSPIAWGWEFTEGSPWHYIAPAPFDALGMAKLYGQNPQSLADKMDALFAAPLGFKEGGYGQTIHEMVEAQQGAMGQYAHPNEPVHHLVWLYNAVGRPHEAQKRLRQILSPTSGFYTLSLGTGGGWLGDEDNGQMSAWYVFAAAGLYPASPGIPEYFIGSPLFSKVRIHLEGGKSFTIEAHNNSERNVYVQHATLNGAPYNKTVISHDAILAGGTLALTLGPNPSTWGHQEGAWPTSLSDAQTAKLPLQDVTQEAAVVITPESANRFSHLLTDNDSSTVWHGDSAQAVMQVTLPEPALVAQYTLTCGSSPQVCAPTMWRLEGTADGTHWQVLDSRDGETFEFPYQLRPFLLAQPKAVKEVRLTLAAPTAAGCLHLAEIEILAQQHVLKSP